MKKILIYTIVFLMSCAKPEQPPLTGKEKSFFDKLSKFNNCTVRRDIDVMLLGRFAKKSRRGQYNLQLLLNCDDLLRINQNEDSIKKNSFVLAKELYNTVLDSSHQYNLIGISFTCDTSSAKYRVMIYNYPTDSLKIGYN